MALSLNHIQGKNGSHWGTFVRETGADHLLLVGIDAAKFTHKAVISTFYGDILVKPFEFDASLSGFRHFQKRIQTVLETHGNCKVVIGIETTGHYYEDLVRRCYQEGYHTRVINAATTANERMSLLNSSKTDNLDLMAIIQSLIHGRGTSSELPSGSVQELKKHTRARRELVNERTKIQNIIAMYLDHIFRKFQGKSVWVGGVRKHLKPFYKLFGKASCYLMRNYPHPSDIINLGKEGIREISIKENLKIRDELIDILFKLADDSISPPKRQVEVDIFLMHQKLDHLEVLNTQLKLLERKIEDLFIETEGAILLSVPGIGFISGAELYAEMGDISDFDHAGQLIKMAGTNPIIKQSGGRKPTYFGVSQQGRRSFRNIVYQVGKSLSVNNPEMTTRYKGMIDRGKHCRQAYIALGNRMLRIAFSMIRHQTLYESNDSSYALADVLKKKLRADNVRFFYEKFVITSSVTSA